MTVVTKDLRDDAARCNAIRVHDRSILVEAGAGSGKTRVLTRRIARRVAEGEVDPRRVLAVTFTRKAAACNGSSLLL